MVIQISVPLDTEVESTQPLHLEVFAGQTAWRELPETFFYQAGNLCSYSKARPVSSFLDLL